MRQLTILVLLAVMVLVSTGCAPTKAAEKARVKCPACGYEFDVPLEPGNGR